MASVIHLAAGKIDDKMEPRGIRAGADQGEPQVRSVLMESGNGQIGVWDCEPGGWPVVDRANTEVCVIQSGAGTITDQITGEAFAVCAGDIVVLPVGWSGRWDITESLRKVFVTY